jgi:hypothetical protein
MAWGYSLLFLDGRQTFHKGRGHEIEMGFELKNCAPFVGGGPNSNTNASHPRKGSETYT